LEGFDIPALSATEGLQGNGIQARFPQGAGEQRGDKGFSDFRIRARDEEVHGFEKCGINPKTDFGQDDKMSMIYRKLLGLLGAATA
jgi:hypothetical protein